MVSILSVGIELLDNQHKRMDRKGELFDAGKESGPGNTWENAWFSKPILKYFRMKKVYAEIRYPEYEQRKAHAALSNSWN